MHSFCNINRLVLEAGTKWSPFLNLSRCWNVSNATMYTDLGRVVISFAQWRYRNQWSSTEVRLLLVENFYQYPAMTMLKYHRLRQFLKVSAETYNINTNIIWKVGSKVNVKGSLLHYGAHKDYSSLHQLSYRSYRSFMYLFILLNFLLSNLQHNYES